MRRTTDRRPRWLRLRYATSCAHCRAELPKGALVFYFPLVRAFYGEDCCRSGTNEARTFHALVEDARGVA